MRHIVLGQHEPELLRHHVHCMHRYERGERKLLGRGLHGRLLQPQLRRLQQHVGRRLRDEPPDRYWALREVQQRVPAGRNLPERRMRVPHLIGTDLLRGMHQHAD